jgi:hypothetical protein
MRCVIVDAPCFVLSVDDRWCDVPRPWRASRTRTRTRTVPVEAQTYQKYLLFINDDVSKV